MGLKRDTDGDLSDLAIIRHYGSKKLRSFNLARPGSLLNPFDPQAWPLFDSGLWRFLSMDKWWIVITAFLLGFFVGMMFVILVDGRIVIT